MPSAIVFSVDASAPPDAQQLLRSVVSKLVVEDLVEKEMQAFTLALPPHEGTAALVRIATVDDKMETELERLAAAPLRIPGGTLEHCADHPLAARRSYEDLYRKSPAAEKEFCFEFLTPTCFHHGDHDVPLPLSRPLFSGLYRRWKQAHPRIALHEEVVDAAENHLVVTSLRIETQPFREERAVKIGFAGSVTYRIAGTVPREILHELNTLADFAFFAAVGQKTQSGMGLVRRLPAR